MDLRDKNRYFEIMKSLTACNADVYYRDEELDEVLALQGQMVAATFGTEHVANSRLRIDDVLNHLKSMNDQLGNPAGSVLERFGTDCKAFEKSLKAEMAGINDRNGLNYVLSRVPKSKAIYNLVIAGKRKKTMIDALLISKKGIVVVEVRNNDGEAFIDRSGILGYSDDYYRYENILGILAAKEALVREAIIRPLGYGDDVVNSIVVFTGISSIRNKCRLVKAEVLEEALPVIKNVTGEDVLSELDVYRIRNKALEVMDDEEHDLPFDAESMKKHFALLMVILERRSRQLQFDDAYYDNGQVVDNLREEENDPWREVKLTAAMAGIFSIGLVIATKGLGSVAAATAIIKGII